MFYRVFALSVILFAGVASAEEDPTRIAGGPRQLDDKGDCSIYRPTWEGLGWATSLGVVEFGPEALIPYFLGGEHTAEDLALGQQLWSVYSRLHIAYSGRDPITLSIGYDQLAEAFARAREIQPGQSGPRLPMPVAPINPTAEQKRLHAVDKRLWSVSWLEFLTLEQLEEMRAVMYQTPTCAGLSYP